MSPTPPLTRRERILNKYASLLIFLATTIAPNAARADEYAIQANTGANRLSITAKLSDVSNGEKLCLPAFGQRYGEQFVIGEFSPTHNPPPIDDAGCFVANHDASYTIRYQLTMAQLPDDRYWFASKLSPHASNNFMAFPGESLFIERNLTTQQNDTIVRVYGAPAQSTLQILKQSAPPQVAAFTAPSAYELTRSYWTFGSPQTLQTKTKSTTLTIVYDTATAQHARTIQREATRIWDYYAQAIPSKAPRHITIFAFHARFDALYHHGFARPNGIVIQLGRTSATQPAQRRILIAHELFHLFNGESVQFSTSDYGTTAWFREGMTQYIALQTLRSLSLLDDSQINAWLSDAYQRNAHTTNGDDFAYYYGYIISLAIEQQWQIYQTPHTILGFWQWLARQPYWSLTYNNNGLRSILSAYSSFDFDDFFARYIDDTRQLPATAILQRANLCTYKSKQLRYSTGLTYAIDAHNAALIVHKTLPQSPAAQAELTPGTRIAPTDDTDWTSPTDKTIRTFRPAPSTIRLPTLPYAIDAETIAPCPPTPHK